MLTKESSDSIGEVIRGIGDVANGMNETMAGLREISIGNGQITESLTELEQDDRGGEDAGNQMREGTGRIEQSFKYIADIANENKRGIDEMKDGIGGILRLDVLTPPVSRRRTPQHPGPRSEMREVQA